MFDAAANQHTQGEAWIASMKTVGASYKKIEDQIIYSAGDQQKVIHLVHP